MPKIGEELIAAAVHGEPLTIAILFMGLTCLGLIWLASVAIKSVKSNNKEKR